jgi:hypothetical protein
MSAAADLLLKLSQSPLGIFILSSSAVGTVVSVKKVSLRVLKTTCQFLLEAETIWRGYLEDRRKMLQVPSQRQG